MLQSWKSNKLYVILEWSFYVDFDTTDIILEETILALFIKASFIYLKIVYWKVDRRDIKRFKYFINNAG